MKILYEYGYIEQIQEYHIAFTPCLLYLLDMSAAALTSYSRHLSLAERACAFLSASTDPFQAVKNCITKLESAGFSRLENAGFASQNIQRGGKYYYTVHHSTLVAFTVGEQYQPGGKGGFLIIGGHTDSVRDDNDTY